jgi:hypothetical protein
MKYGNNQTSASNNPTEPDAYRPLPSILKSSRSEPEGMRFKPQTSGANKVNNASQMPQQPPTNSVSSFIGGSEGVRHSF